MSAPNSGKKPQLRPRGPPPAASLPSYDPLLDKNLRGYFSSEEVQKQLYSAGLIDAEGRVLNMAGASGKLHVVDNELKRIEKEEEQLAKEEADLRRRVRELRLMRLVEEQKLRKLALVKEEERIRQEVIRLVGESTRGGADRSAFAAASVSMATAGANGVGSLYGGLGGPSTMDGLGGGREGGGDGLGDGEGGAGGGVTEDGIYDAAGGINGSASPVAAAEAGDQGGFGAAAATAASPIQLAPPLAGHVAEGRGADRPAAAGAGTSTLSAPAEVAPPSLSSAVVVVEAKQGREDHALPSAAAADASTATEAATEAAGGDAPPEGKQQETEVAPDILEMLRARTLTSNAVLPTTPGMHAKRPSKAGAGTEGEGNGEASASVEGAAEEHKDG